MGDLISRSALIELFDNYCVGNCEVCAYEKHTHQCELIEVAPVVEAVPVVHGEWIIDPIENLNDIVYTVHCSCCGWKETSLLKRNFCSNCGADMRKKV